MRLKFLTAKFLTAATVGIGMLVGVATAQRGGNGGNAGNQGQAQSSQANGGQQPNQQAGANGQAQEPGSVSGQVVSGTTGEPLRKVSLTLNPTGGRGGQASAATSDNSGTFLFQNVAPGTYQLSGDRTGFTRQTYGLDQPGRQVRPIPVNSGDAVKGIVLKLTPHSVVTGRVFDEDGDPLQSARVQVWRYSYPQGKRQLTQVGTGSTNDLGEYRIAGLAPGRYFVSAEMNRPGGRGRFGAAEAGSDDYIQTYYPRGIEPANATPLDLVPGSEVRGIDIGLTRSRLFTISGVVDGAGSLELQPPPDFQGKGKGRGAFGGGPGGPGGPGGQGRGRGGQIAIAAGVDPATVDQLQSLIQQAKGRGPSAVTVQLMRQDGQQNGVQGTQVDSNTGAFSFPRVQPGAYYVMAQTRPQAGQELYARIPVTVSSGDVQNVRVRLEPPLQLTGKISVDKAGAPAAQTSSAQTSATQTSTGATGTTTDLDLSKIRVNFATTLPAFGVRQNTQMQTDGTFASTIPAGTYTVELNGVPQGYYLKSLKLGNREVPDGIVDLSFTGGQLDILLGADSGTLTGKVENNRSEPMARARVTAVPHNQSKRRDLYKQATAGDDGSFTLSGLVPGSYDLFAWEEVDQNAWMDAEFRRPFTNAAKAVDVKAGSSANVNLRAVDRGQMAAAGVQ